MSRAEQQTKQLTSLLGGIVMQTKKNIRKESRMKNSSTRITFGITELEGRLGSFETASDLTLKVRTPASFKVSDMKRMRRDCEILKQKLEDHPEEMCELLSLVVNGRMEDAQATAKRLDFDEDDFTAKEGGLLWLAVAVALAILLWPKKAY